MKTRIVYEEDGPRIQLDPLHSDRPGCSGCMSVLIITLINSLGTVCLISL